MLLYILKMEVFLVLGEKISAWIYLIDVILLKSFHEKIISKSLQFHRKFTPCCFIYIHRERERETYTLFLVASLYRLNILEDMDGVMFLNICFASTNPRHTPKFRQEVRQ